MSRRSVWLRVLVLVLVLVASGLAFIAFSASTAPREVGVALTTGGVTGFVFLVVQSVVAKADERERLLLNLSTTQALP